MGFSSYYIPGHSGTQFKQTKAFKTTKDLVNRRVSTNGVVTKQSVTYTNGFNHLQFLIKWVIMILFFISTFFILKMTEAVSLYSFTLTPQEKLLYHSDYGCVQLDRFQKDIQQGILHLDACDLDSAHYYFLGAISIAYYDKNARVGLANVYWEGCAADSLYCKEAEEYSDYLKVMSYSYDLPRDKEDIYYELP